MTNSTPYNPLDKRNLGESVAEALLESPVHRLPPDRFEGAGIYAIYYVGDFPHYSAITNANSEGKWERPIYVGKAIPVGGRKGGFGLDASTGNKLFGRLTKHARSIQESKNLDLSHFFCRYLVVEDIWIPLGESLLIEMFKPLWNVVLDGFGNHDPGAGRSGSQQSKWDTLHPGRSWAEGYKLGKNENEIIDLIIKHFDPA